MKSKQTPRHSWRFEAIGTQWSIETKATISTEIREAVTCYIDMFDAEFSRFRDDSIVGQMAQSSGTYYFSDRYKTLLDFYKQIYEVTDGAVTPMIGDALVGMGYDKEYSFRVKQQVDVANWNERMQWNGTSATITKPLVFDVGAAGKGYLIDQIGDILTQYNIDDYVIDGSGDILHKGNVEEVVGLEHPDDPSRVIGAVRVKNESLCASATNRRTWGEDMHHVIDARTSKPARGIVATWVITPSAMIADGLATALFFCDPNGLREIADFDYVRMSNQGTIEYSERFVGELFI